MKASITFVFMCSVCMVATGKNIEDTSLLSPNRSPGDISKGKCAEYAKYAYTTSNNNEKIYECDSESSDSNITNVDAARKEFPHMVHIGFQLKDGRIDYICQGSLISENYVLTVAHCLLNTKVGPPKMARIGITDVDDTEHRQELKIAAIITHPDTDKLYHDIALLKLEKPVEINAYVRPACLNTERNFPYQEAIVTGWGKNVVTGNRSKHLAKGILKIYSTEQCNKTYADKLSTQLYQGFVEDYMICAGIKSGKDTCQGDSGVPLQVRIKDSEDLKCMYYILGLTSFGASECGNPDLPSVYTRVSYYVKWIEDIVWPVM